MSTPLTLRPGHRDDGRPVLTAEGEIDMSNVDRFGTALADAVADAAGRAGGGPVVVDLSAVTYLDSGAINAMFTHAEQLKLVCNPLLVRALIFSGLAEVVDIVEVDAGTADTADADPQDAEIRDSEIQDADTRDADTPNADTRDADIPETDTGEAARPDAGT